MHDPLGIFWNEVYILFYKIVWCLLISFIPKIEHLRVYSLNKSDKAEQFTIFSTSSTLTCTIQGSYLCAFHDETSPSMSASACVSLRSLLSIHLDMFKAQFPWTDLYQVLLLRIHNSVQNIVLQKLFSSAVNTVYRY
jgi:hypothetical protein